METVKSSFEKLVFLGFQPILLFPKTKKPIFASWNKNYNPNKYFRIIDNNSDYNIGVLLGDVIDVEGDNEKANKFLDNLFSDIHHPVYKSFKSSHHLFRARSNFNVTRFNQNGIEIRAKGHQSVVPPSIHEIDGAIYEWINDVTHISTLPILNINLEQEIYRFCNNIGAKVLRKHSMRIWCSKCEKQIMLNKKRTHLEIEIFKRMNQKWKCHKCRPFSIKNEIKSFRKSGCKDD